MNNANVAVIAPHDEPEQSEMWRALTVAAVLLSAGIGMTALVQLYAIHTDAYDPVRDDRMMPDMAAALPTRLKWIAGVCAVVAIPGLLVLRRSYKHH